jgi:hypothetical protein
VGGKHNLHYVKKDMSNQIACANQKPIGVDINALIDLFEHKQMEDPDFFFSIEPDESNTSKNIFWVDGRFRRAYQEFGDVVTFDTTYSANKYSMSLVAFIGANHHRQYSLVVPS